MQAPILRADHTASGGNRGGSRKRRVGFKCLDLLPAGQVQHVKQAAIGPDANAVAGEEFTRAPVAKVQVAFPVLAFRQSIRLIPAAEE